MASTDTKKAHVVPQSYLERFATDPGRIWVFDKFTIRAYGASIKDIAQERYFYDVVEETDTGPIRSQGVEHYLADAENFYKDCIDRLLGGLVDGKILPEQKDELAFFVMLQALRTKEIRQRMIQFFQSGSKQILGRAELDGYEGPIPDLSSVDHFRPEDASEWHAKFLHPIHLWAVSRPFLDHIWVIGLNHSTRLLYTSDNPVIAQAHVPQSKLIGASGLAAEGTEIQLPLTPRHVLLLFERSYFQEHEALDGHILDLNDDQVDRCNSFQISNSERQIFCGVDDFDLARRYLALYPQARYPERYRLDLTTHPNLVDDDL